MSASTDSASEASRRTILIVDDHPITRQGLSLLIDFEETLTVCGEAANARQGLDAAVQLKPDLLLADLSLPDKGGLELIKDVLAVVPEQRILVFSMHDEAVYAERALRAGARGYVMKHEGGAKIIEAVHRILQGEIAVSPSIAGRILSGLCQTKRSQEQSSPIAQLSDREFEVFQMFGKGKSTKEIAADLGLSAKTIEAHRLRMREKLGFQSSQELIHYAIQWVESA